MPWWVFGVIAAAAVALRYVVLPALGIKGGASIGLSQVQNDQTIHLGDVHGPTTLYITMPSPGQVILWSLSVDGKAYYASGEDLGVAPFAGAGSIWIGTDLNLPLALPSGQVVVVLAWPSGLALPVLKQLGPQSPQQLDAEGLLHKTKYTVLYGS